MAQDKNDHWDAGEAAKASDLIDLQPGGVVSRTIIKKKTGTVTVFAFDEDEGLSEHTTPYDALLMDLEGKADITISGTPYSLETGDLIKLPAGEPHSVKAVTPFKMLLIMIRE